MKYTYFFSLLTRSIGWENGAVQRELACNYGGPVKSSWATDIGQVQNRAGTLERHFGAHT